MRRFVIGITVAALAVAVADHWGDGTAERFVVLSSHFRDVLTEDYRIPADRIEWMQELFVKAGVLPKTVPVATLVFA